MKHQKLNQNKKNTSSITEKKYKKIQIKKKWKNESAFEQRLKQQKPLHEQYSNFVHESQISDQLIAGQYIYYYINQQTNILSQMKQQMFSKKFTKHLFPLSILQQKSILLSFLNKVKQQNILSKNLIIAQKRWFYSKFKNDRRILYFEICYRKGNFKINWNNCKAYLILKMKLVSS